MEREDRGGAPEGPEGEAVALVRRFLAAMEARDLAAARACMAEGAAMNFPGGARMARLEDLLAWARPRYRRVAKSYEGFEALDGAGGQVVWCRGTLSGEWPDGAPFAGIRFIDRFEVRAGLIRRQDVWNDMGEAMAGRGA